MSLSCEAQQLTKENVPHWAKGKIAHNIRHCIFFHLLSSPKEKYLYSLLSCMPVLHSQKTMLWRNEVLQSNAVLLTSIHFNQKSCCHLQAGGCFWASQMFFFFSFFFFFCEGWILFKNNMCYLRCDDVYCVLKCSIPVFFLYHGNIPSGKCCLLKRLNT